MGYQATQVELSYEFQQITPEKDPDYQAYQRFKKQFGQDDNTLVLGIRPQVFFRERLFNQWAKLADTMQRLPGVTKVISVADVRTMRKHPQGRRFTHERVFPARVSSQKQLDSLRKAFLDLPFYKGMIFNQETQATYMAVRLEREVLSSDKRVALVEDIRRLALGFEKDQRTDVYFSGLPYIRTRVTNKVERELRFFSFLSVAVTALLLLIFFRKPINMVFPLLVIGIMITWTLGTMGLLGYKITLLSSLIPPLIIIIGIPNFIYFLNKYHQEYRKHGNKARAIARMVQKIGVVTLLTNLTTAIGFLVLATTQSPILREFGLVAGLNIIATFLVSIIVFPVVFSYLPEPSSRHLKYLDNPIMDRVLGRLYHTMFHHRRVIYVCAALLTGFSLWGATQLKAVSYVLDDIPKDDQLQRDLAFFERHFEGIMPFEITVDTQQKNGLYRIAHLKKIQRLQDSMAATGFLSRSLSPVDAVSFARQAFYNGQPSFYDIPQRRERSFLLPYLRNTRLGNTTAFSLTDSNMQVARITAQVEDVGSTKMRDLVAQLREDIDAIFDGDSNVSLTGVSLIVLKNNQYLIKSLVQSLVLAFLLVSILMGLLFGKIRMVVISLAPNFLPLLLTAGIMGWTGIPLKPSTVLVFSIAFGISVDDALHFLAKYRQELKQHNWDIPKTVSISLVETGRSMIYTSFVLFSGFVIFYFSSFGGTSFLGLLTSMTLLFAMLTNLLLLPALILEFDSSRRGSRFHPRNRRRLRSPSYTANPNGPRYVETDVTVSNPSTGNADAPG
jgi:predicted RND superfamily exporter protein